MTTKFLMAALCMAGCLLSPYLLQAQAIDTTFKSPFTNDVIYSVALQQDGHVIAGGHLQTIHTGNIARLTSQGPVDPSFHTGSGFNGDVRVIHSLPDDKLLVGGIFSSYNGVNVKHLVRLTKDGDPDVSFNSTTGIDGSNNGVYAIQSLPDGKLLVGGYITSYSGSPANMLIRLNADGTPDKTFKTTTDYSGTVLSIGVQSDGKILVGGLVTKNNDPKSLVVLVRLNTDGSLDPSFAVSSSNLNSVNSIAVEPDDRIVVGGDFEKYNNQSYSYIVRLNKDGDIDANFKVVDGFYAIHGGVITYPLYTVSDIVLQQDGTMVVAGEFSKYQGTAADGIVKINSDGTLAHTFQACSRSGLDGPIYHIERQPDGKFLAGGYFDDYRNTASTVCLFRLNNDSTAVGLASDFNYIADGYNVNFTNKSTGNKGSVWQFGDGSSSSVVNPFHTYKQGGTYTVQLSSSDACNTVTASKTVTLTGITGIHNNIGGNTGSVTVDIEGGGFANGMQVYLQRDGQTDIQGDTALVKSSSLITTTFNLTNKVFGNWNVIALFPNGNRDTLHNGFTVAPWIDSSLSATITGDWVLRMGFNQVYTVTYSNKGNTDVNFVPLLISGLPLGTQIELVEPLYRLSSLPGYDTLGVDSLHIPTTFDDTALNMSFRQLIIGTIPAGATKTLHLIFHVPTTATLESSRTIQVSLGNPISDPADDKEVTGNSGSVPANFGSDCYGKINQIGIAAVVEEIAKFDPTGIASCTLGLGKTILNFVKIMKSDPESSKREKYLDYSEMSATLGGLVKPCLMASLTILTAATAPEFLGEEIKFQEKMLAEDAVGEVIEGVSEGAGIGHDLIEAYQACSPFFKHLFASKLQVIIGNAWDPNHKFGPGDSSSSHFTVKDPFNYVINFENDPQANLNAQTVTVTDTLKAGYFDRSSFGFTSVMIGDSSFTLSSPVRSFIHDFDFSRQYAIKARVSAVFDTTSGIARWTFQSIDPATNQVTTNALVGFLPPDVLSPNGLGYIGYTVQPNPALHSGDSIFNSATIKFDTNPVIQTNTWKNVFDLVSPASKVRALPIRTTDSTFSVSWDGKDSVSGIGGFDIYQAVDDGSYQIWRVDDSARQHTFTGTPGSTYHFFSIARDKAGNIESMKSLPEATISIVKDTAAPVPGTKMGPLSAQLGTGNSVLLSWNTSPEYNNRGFVVQRSTGADWDSIGFVKGGGSSQTGHNYSFPDNTVQAGQEYKYRLEQVDSNSNFVYSNEVSVLIPDVSLSVSLKISPNPLHGSATITWSLSEPTNVSIRLIDFSGRVITHLKEEDEKKGLYSLDFNTFSHGLSKGIYLIELQTARNKIVKKIICL